MLVGWGWSKYASCTVKGADCEDFSSGRSETVGAPWATEGEALESKRERRESRGGLVEVRKQTGRKAVVLNSARAAPGIGLGLSHGERALRGGQGGELRLISRAQVADHGRLALEEDERSREEGRVADRSDRKSGGQALGGEDSEVAHGLVGVDADADRLARHLAHLLTVGVLKDSHRGRGRPVEDRAARLLKGAPDVG